MQSACKVVMVVLGVLAGGAAPAVAFELQVNSNATFSQYEAAVAASADGDFVVVWADQLEPSVGIFGQRFASSGAPVGTEFQVNTYTTGTQDQPAVTSTAAGDFVVVWRSDGQDGSAEGIFGQRYSSSGAAVGTEFQVNTHITSSQEMPAIAAAASGELMVVWQDNSGHDGSFSGIFAQRYTSSGAVAGTEFRVNTFTTSPQSAPAVAAAAGGEFVVVWQSYTQDGAGGGIFGQRYNSSGAALGTEFQVNTYTTSAQYNPAVAANTTGDFAIVWQSDQDGSNAGVFGQRYASNGAVLGSEYQINTYTTGQQLNPSVAASGTDFMVAWQSDGPDGDVSGIFAQRYAGNGTAVGSELQLNAYTTSDQQRVAVVGNTDGRFTAVWDSDGQDGNGLGVFASVVNPQLQVNTYTTHCQDAPAVAAGGDGNFVVVWNSYEQDGSQQGVFGQRYSSSGGAVGTEFQVNTFTTLNQAAPAVGAGPAGDFVAVWQSDQQDGSLAGIFGQRFASSGAAAGTEFQVNSYTTNRQATPDVALNGLGDALVVWRSNLQDGDAEGIYAQRYGSTGAIAGTEFRVNASTTGFQKNGRVAAYGGNNFVVVWDSDDLSAREVLAQRYDSAGTPVGTAFQVNTFTTDVQAYPAAAAAGDGGFVVVWHSRDQDGDAYGVFGQLFGSSGAMLGTEFQVNTHPTDFQYRPRVASNTAGDFEVVWQSFGQDGAGYGIFGRHYDRSGAPLGSDFQVNAVFGEDQIVPAIAAGPRGGALVAWSDNLDGDTCSVSAAPAQLPGRCPATPQLCISGFAKGRLFVKDSPPGKEKLLAKLLGGPEILQTAFGNPLAPGGSAYDLCIYDDTSRLAAEVRVDRAGDTTCSGGSDECWKAIGGGPPLGRGFKYKDADAAALGVTQMFLKGGVGSVGKSKILVKGKTAHLPLPIAAALVTTTAVTVQLRVGGSSAQACYGITLSDVTRQESDQFKIK